MPGTDKKAAEEIKDSPELEESELLAKEVDKVEKTASMKDLDEEAEKSRHVKKKKRRQTWWNSRPFVFSFALLIFGLAIVALIYMDKENAFRPSWMNSPGFQSLFSFVGIQPINIYATAWVTFGFAIAGGFTLFFAFFFHKPIKERREKARIKKNKPIDEKWVRSFNVKYVITCALAFLVVVGAILGVCFLLGIWDAVASNWNSAENMNVMLNLLMALGILLMWVLIVPVAFAIIWLAFKIVTILFGGMASAVAKNMMSNGNYQDFKAAAETAAAERRRDAGLSLPGDYALLGQDALSRVDFSNLQVTIDPNKIQGMNQLVGGQNKRKDEPEGDLFPALSVIDAKWADIYAAQEEARAKKEAEEKYQRDLAKAQAEYDEALKTATPDHPAQKPQILIDEEKRLEEEEIARKEKEEAEALAKAEEELRIQKLESARMEYEAALQEAKEAGLPAPEKPEILKEEDARAEQEKAKKGGAVIGTAVQDGSPEAAAKAFEEAKANHKVMTYKDFKTLAYRFQAYLCKRKYYFDLNVIRSWIAAFSAARLIILQGLSGTGKSTLPRVFLEYIGGKAYFFPVQATWRDRSDIVGYYSDFSGQFKETELLKKLYEASYIPEQVNIMVLDEMNISRVEYYFADFLSIFEYPPADWLVPLMQVKLGTPVPKFIEGGAVRIPVNTWFIGTSNIDDSTFTITDKVYDRAIVIDFNHVNLPFKTDYDPSPYPITMDEFTACINEALADKRNHLDEQERDKFLKLTQFISDTFDIQFGNRIMNQIDRFVPVFVALGGTKNEALDIMLARKILRKLDGHFESYVKEGLVKLSRYLNQNYGSGVMVESEAAIAKYQRKLS